MFVPHAVEGDDKLTPLFYVKNLYDGKLAIPTQPEHAKKTFIRFDDSNTTNVTILTPTDSDYRLIITGIMTVTEATSGQIELDWEPSSSCIWRHYAAVTNVMQHTGMHIDGGADEYVELTNTTGANEYTIHITYYEVPD